MFDARATQQLEALFDQQMWALGRDVLRPGGNLLAARGLARRATSSTWFAEYDWGHLELCSSGVGVTCTERSLRLERGPVGPQLREASPLLFMQLATWFADYEAWVPHAAGSTWRHDTLTARTRPPRFAASDMEPLWRQAASMIGLSRRVTTTITAASTSPASTSTT